MISRCVRRSAGLHLLGYTVVTAFAAGDTMSIIGKLLRILPALLLAAFLGAGFAADIPAQDVEALVSAERVDIDALKDYGPGVMPVLAGIYERSDPDRRAVIAWVFYRLGWKSAEAERALMPDVHTSHRQLRLQVQWALGRVSDAPEVVEVLLNNMRHDTNPLFRDKAACALAYDQIHLSERQKLRVYAGLVESLASDNPQVRDISMKALKIHTGQTKGFQPRANAVERADAIRKWESWLEEYRDNL